MKAATVRLFSWVLVIVLAAPLALPAVASSDYVKSGKGKSTLLDAASVAEAALSRVQMAEEASRVTASLPITATQELTDTAHILVTAPLTATEFSTSTVSIPDAAVIAPPRVTMNVDPFQVLPGDVITYSVAITNVAETSLEQVVLDNPLPAGVVYVAQSGVGFSYSARDGRLTWSLRALAPGEAARGGFQLRATGLSIGALIVNTVSASSASTPLVTASAVVEVAPPRQSRVWATPGEGGWLRSEDGRVDLRAPAGAVARWYSDVFFAADSHFGAMTKISNGYGGEIEFVSGHRGGNGDNPHVVSARKEKYGVTDLAEQTWNYVGVNWDESGGNEMAKGYKEVQVTRPDGAIERHFFHGIETVGGQASDHLAGRERKVSVTSDNTEMSRIETTWGASTDSLPVSPAQGAAERIKPRHVRVASTETFEVGKQLVRTEYSYDPNKQGETQWGNVTRTRERVWTNGAWSNPYRTSYIWYVPNVAQSITNKPARIEQYEGCGDCGGGIAGSIVSQRLLYYDQDTAGDWEDPPTRGLLRFETIGSGVLGEIPLLKTEYRYWSNGNLRQVIDGLGHATEIFYDSQFQVYPVCVKNALGHTTKTRYYGVPGSTENGCTTTAGTAAWNSSGALTSGAFFGQIEETADANDAFTSFSKVRTSW